jgi:hypothetical protein
MTDHQLAELRRIENDMVQIREALTALSMRLFETHDRLVAILMAEFAPPLTR